MEIVFKPIACAIRKRSAQYSCGTRDGCISPALILNGFPSSRKSLSPMVKVAAASGSATSARHAAAKRARQLLKINWFMVKVLADVKIRRHRKKYHKRAS